MGKRKFYLTHHQVTARERKRAQVEGTWNFLPYMEEIGAAYERAADNSGDQTVLRCWDALASDSHLRVEDLEDSYDITQVQFEPYENAEQQDYDVRQFGQFLVSDQNSEHPIWSVEDNVAFRKVHDLMGHIPSGGDFSWEGENLACGEHFKFLDHEARIALFVECIMQTAAVGVYREFLEQKCFIPDNFDPELGYFPIGDAQPYNDDAGKIYWNRGAKRSRADSKAIVEAFRSVGLDTREKILEALEMEKRMPQGLPMEKSSHSPMRKTDKTRLRRPAI